LVQSSKKVKSPKQAIAIALSEAGMSRKPMMQKEELLLKTHLQDQNLVIK
jgi:hypothetical protein